MESSADFLPFSIARLLEGKPYQVDTTGMSDSRVRLYEDCVLKIGPVDRETIAVMQFLQGKLPVPEILDYAVEGNTKYLLMTRIRGKMACDPDCLANRYSTVPLLAQALTLFHSTDPAGCPRTRSLDVYLRMAEERVSAGLVDLENTEPDTFGEGGFRDPEALLFWLKNNRPDTEPSVLTHGDFCLPNVFLDNGKISGFIDLGDTGIGDPWRDIALCYRSLSHNYAGVYGGKTYPDFDPDILFSLLGIRKDEERLRWHLLLDELF